MKTHYIFLALVFLPLGLKSQNIESLGYQELAKLIEDYFHAEEYEKGIALGTTTLARLEKEKHPMDTTYAGFLEQMAYLNGKIADYEKSEKFYMQTKDAYTKLLGKESKKYLELMDNLGVHYIRTQQFKLAEVTLLEAIETEKKIFGTSYEYYAINLNNLAFVYRAMGKLEQTEALFKESLALYDKKQPDAIVPLINVAQILGQMGHYEQSEAYYLEALELAKGVQGGINKYHANVLHDLGSLLTNMSRLESAKSYYLQALEIKKKLSPVKDASYASTLGQLANVYQNFGSFSSALPLYLESAEIKKQTIGEQDIEYATILYNLSHAYIQLDRLEPALKYALQAVAICKKNYGEDYPNYPNLLGGLANVYFKMGKIADAEQLRLETVEINKKIYGIHHSNYISDIGMLAKFYLDVKDYQKSEQYFIHAISTNCKSLYKEPNSVISDSFQIKNISELENYEFYNGKGLIRTLLYYAALKKAQAIESNDLAFWQAEYEIIQTAINLNQRIRNKFTSNEDKKLYLKDLSFFVDGALGTTLKLSNEQNKLDLNIKAFNNAEQNKSVLLADAIKGSRALVLGDLPDSLVLKELELRKRKNALEEKEQKATTIEIKNQIIAQKNKLDQDLSQFIKSIKDKYPKYHALKYGDITVNAKEVQQKLDDKTMLLEYFVGEKATYLFALTKENVELYAIDISRDSLKGKIQKLRLALTNYSLISKNPKKAYELYADIANWFYKKLIQKSLKDKKLENLIIVADGDLGHLPFESFLVESASQKEMDYKKLHYLVNDYNISYNYSATLWKENLEAPQKNTGNKILACAAEYGGTENSLVTRSADVLSLRKSLNPLPAAQKEVVTLSEQFGGSFLNGKDANEGFFKEQAGEYAVIHLAMHGILNPSNPATSSLAFTENGDSLNDNFLQAYEISKMNLTANLVVLSACETGYGRFEQGEGVVSLARSFMYAGVPSLVVSLWQVSDHSTSVIMTYFYKNLAKGMSKDLALRNAKLDYIQMATDITSHPAFWSPFIQLGDSRPIEIAAKGEIWKWAIGGGLGVLLLAGVFVWRRKKE